MARRRPVRAAFTLLEVILSLALAGLLLGALTWAIQLNLKATTSGRSDVERAQLARAALDRMAADIRGAVWYDPIDPNSLVVPPASSSQTSASSSSALPGTSGSGSGSSSGGSGSGGGTSSGGVASATKAESAESATGAVRA
ncbi:MAG TPA: prepilin-type N-terminal cleavage/methylation domain-containing protein, partial [Pirellulales bacterium]|nr:prepilin-type N-terminal cleavage/methylation domain-containing protein [Pirellulales bacterium]